MRHAAALLLAVGCGGTPTVAPVAPAPAPPPPAIAGPRGAIALEAADGRATTLARHGRPITVVALWATYCPPCVDELPYLDALHRAHADDDVAVLAVNVDDRGDPAVRARVAEIERRLALTLPRFYDGGALFEALAPRDAGGRPQLVLPLVAVIDRDFQIHREVGFSPDVPLARYLADKEAVIAAARRGERPRPGPPIAAAPPARQLKLSLPKMSAAELEAFGPRFRAAMAARFPALAAAALDALTARALEAARVGGVLEVDLDALHAH